MNNRSSIRLFVLLVFVIPITAYCIFDFYEGQRKLPVISETRLVKGQTTMRGLSEFQLLNQNGEQVSSTSWKGKIMVVNFFFTHCPVICPRMTANLKKVSDRFRDNPNVCISSFTVDPERDDPAQLRNYVKLFSVDTSKWDLLTGDKKEIYKLARNRFMIVATDGDGGPDDFIHSEKLVLLDKEGRIRGYYTGTDEKEVNKLLQDIKKLIYEY